jgi:hypothetical protein
VAYYCVNLCGICKINFFNPTLALNPSFKTSTEAVDFYSTLEPDFNTIETIPITTSLEEEIPNTTQEIDYPSSSTEFSTIESFVFSSEQLDSDKTSTDSAICQVLTCKNEGKITSNKIKKLTQE